MKSALCNSSDPDIPPASLLAHQAAKVTIELEELAVYCVRCNSFRRKGVLMVPKIVRLPARYSTAATSTPHSSRHAASDVKKRPTIAVNMIGQTVGHYDVSVWFVEVLYSR
jgi:hypothetical protein